MADLLNRRLGLAGWLAATVLAVALALVWWSGEQRVRALTAQLDAGVAATNRELVVCRAEANTLRSAVEVLRPAEGAGRDGALDADSILARSPRGQDACARALEAEALVREATR